MSTNISRKTAAVKSAFRKFLAEAAADGVERLPGERALAAHFQVGRECIRKVLEDALLQGMIRREGRMTFNQMPGGTLAACGRILLISVGEDGRFFYSAMERLYQGLSESISAKGGEIRCFLVNDHVSAEELERELAAAEVILLATVTCRDQARMRRIIACAAEKKVIIRLSGTESFVSREQENFIMADNYLIGKCAAKLLLDSGCRKPLTFWKRCQNKHFSDRAQGFCDTLYQAKCGGAESVFWLDSRHYPAETRKLLAWAAANGFDGFFVMSDEGVENCASMLYDRDKSKWIFPLVTVDGSQDSLRFDPPVCAVGHGTAFCCQAVMETLQNIVDKKFTGVKKLIKPDYHHASSLMLRKEIKYPTE